MIDRNVVVEKSAFKDIDKISDFIISISTPEHAERYAERMFAEIARLSYLAGSLARKPYNMPKRFHPKANVLALRGRKWSVIYHYDDNNVYIDRIIPSSMITY